jgi:CDP-diacylglycerol--glycerol-3-phosphate 3-phosphatidyltransferase
MDYDARCRCCRPSAARASRASLPACPKLLIPVTFTGAIGRVCNYPLRLIIAACVRLRIHPNLLTFTGVIINVGAVSDFGGFWDSVIDRFSDLALSVGLICLYSSLGRTDYVLITSVAMVFATMTSYARARAESLIARCKVGFMERPERIVLFMIGAFTNRMAAVMWVIGVLSVVTVVNRIYYTYVELSGRPQPSRSGPLGFLVRAFYWTDDRATVAYDLWVIAILAFVWLTPPDWLGDPMAVGGQGFLQWLLAR